MKGLSVSSWFHLLFVFAFLNRANAYPGGGTGQTTARAPVSQVPPDDTTSGENPGESPDPNGPSPENWYLATNFNYLRAYFNISAMQVDSELAKSATECAEKLSLVLNPDSTDAKPSGCHAFDDRTTYFNIVRKPSNFEVVVETAREWTVVEKCRFESRYSNYSDERTFYEPSRHFTQAIWRGTTQFGCAVIPLTNFGEHRVTVCEFSPPGNIVFGDAKFNAAFLVNVNAPPEEGDIFDRGESEPISPDSC